MEPKIPGWWSSVPTHSTRSELIKSRKRACIPHPSYDVDKDGVVGPTDFFLSSIFDRDKDNRLNTQESGYAKEAIKNGFLNRFQFGAETHGKQRPCRLLQVRGVVITDDNYSGVAKTYPVLEGTGSVKTLSGLKKNRRTSAKAAGEKIARENVHFREMVTKKEFSLSVKSEIPLNYRELAYRNAREQQGMSPEPDALSLAKALSTNYLQTPNHKTLAEMKQNRKQNRLNSLESGYNEKYLVSTEKLKQREELLWSYTPKVDGKTWSNTRHAVKKQDLEYYLKYFGNRSIGIHGKELPKFNENHREY